MKTLPRPPPTPTRPSRGPFPYLMVGIVLVIAGALGGKFVGAGAAPTPPVPAVLYPTLTPAPTETPLVFPDTLLPADLPASTAYAVLSRGEDPRNFTTVTPSSDTVVRLPPVTTVPPFATATPAPPTPTAYVARVYWERRADGDIYQVNQWSDGRYQTVAERTATRVPPSPTAVPPTATPHPYWTPVVPTPTPGYRLGTLVWSFSSPGYVPVDGYIIASPMKVGDHLVGAARFSGGPVTFEQWHQLVPGGSGTRDLRFEGIAQPFLVAWRATVDGDYDFSFSSEDPARPAWMHIDVGVYRP